MASAAIAKGFRTLLYICDPEDILSSEEQAESINHANDQLKQHIQRRQEAAHHPDTEENTSLQEINANVERINTEHGLTR